MALLGYFAAGVLTWTFLEWLLHGRLFHSRGLRNPFAKEHALHHADPLHMVGWPRKLIGVVFVVGVLVAILRLSLGDFEAAAFPCGLGFMYLVYESVHRVIHTRAPRTSYGRWLRLQHVQHHFHTPKRNFGVTSAVWDHVFRTHVPFTKPLAVPERLAMPWLLDPQSGGLADAYTQDYVLVRRVRDLPDSTTAASAQ
ncbi:sterol desaturase family protein [Actinokineospora auranticolor]|uniref:Fatty acid hydroxylase family protein n=1 Tax=Actinokineospora auranticolor TaxID=155976 RepID=A0A2S6GHX3_9PSEU|nr:sterol desaturase family protein [Actinokineospora auranticolor]PPK64815.1 fatty acid hydroxylase family protein [Actinokineospora auranticolor]